MRRVELMIVLLLTLLVISCRKIKVLGELRFKRRPVTVAVEAHGLAPDYTTHIRIKKEKENETIKVVHLPGKAFVHSVFAVQQGDYMKVCICNAYGGSSFVTIDEATLNVASTQLGQREAEPVEQKCFRSCDNTGKHYLAQTIEMLL